LPWSLLPALGLALVQQLIEKQQFIEFHGKPLFLGSGLDGTAEFHPPLILELSASLAVETNAGLLDESGHANSSGLGSEWAASP